MPGDFHEQQSRGVLSSTNPAQNNPPALGLCCCAVYPGCCRCATSHVTASLLVQVLYLCWLVPLQRQALRLPQLSGSRAWMLRPKQRASSKAMEREQSMAGSSMDRPRKQLLLCQQSLLRVQVTERVARHHCQ